jgi:hypothetical protein
MGDNLNVHTAVVLILWHADPLTGNDREVCNYTTAVTRQNRNAVFCAIRAEML